jgi:hypothetical protein
MIAVKFVEGWKDYKPEDIDELEDRIAEELIGSGLAVNANAFLSENKSKEISLGYHEAKLEGLHKRKRFVQNQLDMLDKQVLVEEEAIAFFNKEMKSPPKNKMMDKAKKSKEV